MSKYNSRYTYNAIESPINLSRLLTVFSIQNPSCDPGTNDLALDTIESILPPGCRITRRNGAILIHKGADKIRPFYLAHLDQVHNFADGFQPVITEGILAAIDDKGKQVGIGGDDKSGIFIAIEMLWALKSVTAVFVPDEEVGCIGSSDVRLRWFRNAAFVMQFDRAHDDYDVIRYTNGMECASDEFFTELEAMPISGEHKWDFDAVGSITDVGELASRGLPVSCCNVAAGYLDAHTSRETVDLVKLGHSLRFAYEAGFLLGDKQWEHTPSPSYGGGYGSYVDYRQQDYTGNAGCGWSYDEYERNGYVNTAGRTPKPKLAARGLNPRAPRYYDYWLTHTGLLICPPVAHGWHAHRGVPVPKYTTDDRSIFKGFWTPEEYDPAIAAFRKLLLDKDLPLDVADVIYTVATLRRLYHRKWVHESTGRTPYVKFQDELSKHWPEGHELYANALYAAKLQDAGFTFDLHCVEYLEEFMPEGWADPIEAPASRPTLMGGDDEAPDDVVDAEILDEDEEDDTDDDFDSISDAVGERMAVIKQLSNSGFDPVRFSLHELEDKELFKAWGMVCTGSEHNAVETVLDRQA